MNTHVKTPALLPKGFEDLLSPAAEQEAQAIATLMQVFASHNYHRIKPPLAEFEETLLGGGPGAKLADQTFRVMDKESGKMLAIRSDITPQIARIVTTRLADAPRPLRLSYANDVLRMSGSQQRTLRQFCQVGCELVDAGSIDNNVECVVLAAKGLHALGIPGISFDFSLPSIFQELIAINQGDNNNIDAMRAELSGQAQKSIDKLLALGLSMSAQNDIKQLQEIINRVREALNAANTPGIGFTVDPLETKGFEYHKGFAFAVFAKGVNGELGRGGSYMLGDNQAASGFTFYMDTVRRGCVEQHR